MPGSRKLSGGQKQRLAVACALVGRPELLFLDEPTTGLDPQSRRQLWDVLGRFQRRGRHHPAHHALHGRGPALCDRVGIMDHGRIIALGTPRELMLSLGAEHVVEFAVEAGAAPVAADLRALPGVRDVRLRRRTWRWRPRNCTAPCRRCSTCCASDGATLSQLGTHSATLEDVFVTLTGRQLRDE